MRARNEPRGAAHGRGVLRKVYDHGDPGHVVPEPAERTLSILVPAAVCRGSFAHGRTVLEPGQRQGPIRLRERFVGVHVAMRMQHVVVAENALHSAVDDRVIE